MRRKRQMGVGMIEVLVAMVVGAIGVIGALALSLQTLRGAQEAYYRSLASIKATDMAETLHADGAFGGYVDAWVEEIAANLPEGAGEVVTDGAGNFTILVRWSSRLVTDDDGNPGISVVQLLVSPP